MQTTQSDYFSAYRSLKLTRGSNGVLVAEFHSNGGPLTFTAPDHTRLSDRLCVDVVALVGLHVRLHILRWGSTAPHDPALAVPGPRKCGPPHASMPIWHPGSTVASTTCSQRSRVNRRRHTGFPPEGPSRVGCHMFWKSAPTCTLRLVIIRNGGGLWEGPRTEKECDVVAMTADTKNWGDSVRLGIQPQAKMATQPAGD